MLATEAAPVDLAALEAHLVARGQRLGEAAARHLGRALAAALATEHARLDDEGNLAAVLHGHLEAGLVRVGADGAVAVVAAAAGAPGTAPELLQGGRLTPRADVYALGAILAPLLAGSPDEELLAALATALEPDAARRRITCVELEALLERGADLDAGRRALGEAVRSYLAERDEARPLSTPARVAVALVTAAAVFAAGVAVAEGWLRR